MPRTCGLLSSDRRWGDDRRQPLYLDRPGRRSEDDVERGHVCRAQDRRENKQTEGLKKWASRRTRADELRQTGGVVDWPGRVLRRGTPTRLALGTLGSNGSWQALGANMWPEQPARWVHAAHRTCCTTSSCGRAVYQSNTNRGALGMLSPDSKLSPRAKNLCGESADERMVTRGWCLQDGTAAGSRQRQQAAAGVRHRRLCNAGCSWSTVICRTFSFHGKHKAAVVAL